MMILHVCSVCDHTPLSFPPFPHFVLPVTSPSAILPPFPPFVIPCWPCRDLPRHSLLAVIFFVLPGVTGNLPTPKYTKSYASSTIAVTVFEEKRAHLRPKTLSLQEKHRSCTRKQAKQPQLSRTADGAMRRGSLRSVEMTEIVRLRRQSC